MRNNLREFGRTTVILTTGAGNVRSQLRAVFRFRGRVDLKRKIVRFAIYIYIYIYIYWPRCLLFSKNQEKNDGFWYRGLKNPRKIDVFGRPQSWEILGFSDFSDFPQMEHHDAVWYLYFLIFCLSKKSKNTNIRLQHKPGWWALPGPPEKLENCDLGTTEGPHTAMTT